MILYWLEYRFSACKSLSLRYSSFNPVDLVPTPSSGLFTSNNDSSRFLWQQAQHLKQQRACRTEGLMQVA